MIGTLGNNSSNYDGGNNNVVKSVSDYVDLQVIDLGVEEGFIDSNKSEKINLTKVSISGTAKRDLNNTEIDITSIVGDNNIAINGYSRYYSDDYWDEESVVNSLTKSGSGSYYSSSSYSYGNYTAGDLLNSFTYYLNNKPKFIMITVYGYYNSSSNSSSLTRKTLERAKIMV
jgi:hypothetical protein